MTIYASSETHTWIEKAVDLFGLPKDALRSIRVDSSQRLRLDDLNSQLLADLGDGRIPVAVVGNAGTVSTGAIDPLREMAGLCRERRVWFHVDGARAQVATSKSGQQPEQPLPLPERPRGSNPKPQAPVDCHGDGDSEVVARLKRQYAEKSRDWQARGYPKSWKWHSECLG